MKRGSVLPAIMIAVTSLGIVIVLAPVTRTPRQGTLNTNPPRQWESIADLVADKDAIAVVNVTGVYTEAMATDPGPPGGTPTGLPTLPAEELQNAGSMSQLPITVFAASPIETLHDDDDLPVGELFLMELLGHVSQLTTVTEVEERYPSPGHAYLVFMEKTEDGTFGPWWNGMFVVDGPNVTWPDGTPFSLAVGMSSVQFLQAVRDEIEVQY